MREVLFYRTISGRCPVEDFLESLRDKQVEKIFWVLRLVKSLDPVPIQYFKKLSGTHDIWEVRVHAGRDTYRILGFFGGKRLVVLTNAFSKKTDKVPRKEIRLAQRRRKDYIGSAEKQ
ncbi:MAG: type II toxin-antitoxin system RelE/ParE family toxin [Nitrosopumilus sp.]